MKTNKFAALAAILIVGAMTVVASDFPCKEYQDSIMKLIADKEVAIMAQIQANPSLRDQLLASFEAWKAQKLTEMNSVLTAKGCTTTEVIYPPVTPPATTTPPPSSGGTTPPTGTTPPPVVKPPETTPPTVQPPTIPPVPPVTGNPPPSVNHKPPKGDNGGGSPRNCPEMRKGSDPICKGIHRDWMTAKNEVLSSMKPGKERSDVLKNLKDLFGKKLHENCCPQFGGRADK